MYKSLNSTLALSPYSLPPESEVLDRLAILHDREERVRARFSKAQESLQRTGLFRGTRAIQTSKEVYESNSLEGLGPSLGRTHEILTRGAGPTVEEALHLLTFSQDKDLVAVIGLQGARLLTQRLKAARSNGTPWTESDLRQLHSIICRGEDFAGQYKRYHVHIGGVDAHEPPPPIETSAHMSAYVTWLNISAEIPSPVIRAAVAHAWLTHIHPFEDGNGRLARLVANQCLTDGGMPPAIIKHGSQRGAYLDALSASDEGGDIYPLADLFISTLQRYTRELSKPQALQRLIDREISGRTDALFVQWTRSITEFLQVLRAALLLEGLTTRHHGDLDVESFNLIHELNSRGNDWLESVYDNEGRELLLWLGYPTADLRGHMPKRRMVPAIYFSVRNEQGWGRHPFRPISASDLGGFSQFCIVPSSPPHVFALQDGRRKIGGLEESGLELAGAIGRAFRSGKVPRRPRRSGNNVASNEGMPLQR